MRRVTDDIVGHVWVPAGKYWLGDPCYVIKDEMWIDWLESCDYENQKHLIGKTPDGYFAIGFNTAHGDGVYQDQFGNDYGVDAGLIGLVAYGHNPFANNVLVKLVEFTSEVVAEVDDDGNMQFGEYIIITDESDLEEEDEDDDDYEAKWDDEEDEEEGV